MNNKNTQYTDKNFFVNRVSNVTDNSVKTTLSNFIANVLNAIKVKHS